MHRNIATLVLVLSSGGLGLTWLGYYVWRRWIEGVDSATTTIVAGPVFLLLNTENAIWFLVFVMASATQAFIAWRLFGS